MDILGDDEALHDDLKYKRSGRLDMSHGFLHHIRRNQIARWYFVSFLANAANYSKLTLLLYYMC